LGTAFNINAYSDEPVFKTSLIEGAIKVNNKIIEPGQAYVSGKIMQTNIQQDIAWKTGWFDFNGASLEQVMRQLARWYNVEIIYENKTKEYFQGKMDRGLTLNQVLDILEQTGIRFRLQGRQLIVQ
ncbi:MAG: DUF4974 domain-containing protein, partial [Chitinophagaceae bacterium]|nr:DUF4974 domain-containing protein [Chitinophagaceae bacterium]